MINLYKSHSQDDQDNPACIAMVCACDVCDVHFRLGSKVLPSFGLSSTTLRSLSKLPPIQNFLRAVLRFNATTVIRHIYESPTPLRRSLTKSPSWGDWLYIALVVGSRFPSFYRVFSGHSATPPTTHVVKCSRWPDGTERRSHSARPARRLDALCDGFQAARSQVVGPL